MDKFCENVARRKFIVNKKKIKKKTFLAEFNVIEGSPFSNLYSRLYDYLLGGYVNLYKEYKKYYKKEFENFDNFLTERYHLSPEQIQKYSSRNSYYKYVNQGFDDSVFQLLYEEDDFTLYVSNIIGGDCSED